MMRMSIRGAWRLTGGLCIAPTPDGYVRREPSPAIIAKNGAARVGRTRLAAVLLLGLTHMPPGVLAADVELVGSMGSRAVLQIDGGALRTVAVGGLTPEGVKLVALDGDQAVVEIDGRRTRVRLGEGAIRSAPASDGAGLVLHADPRGHFEADGTVNGASVRFLVDTGASLVSLGAGDARRAGVDYRRGTRATSLTAAGPARVWRVRLNTVKFGAITLHDVEALVHEHDLPIALLGMSVLNRFEMRREGSTLTLQRRY